jgi:hypothetical protein
MTVLRFELGIDSNVYPELYAKLASLERLESRAEKLRELAATGLIWELLRLGSPGFAESAPAPFDAQADAAEAGPRSALAAAPATDERPAEAHALPAPPRALPAVDAGSVADHAPRVPQNVPVLFDVVAEGDTAVEFALADATPEPAEGNTATAPEAPRAAAGSAAAASLAEATVTKARSARMKRMKDSGLFQNG